MPSYWLISADSLAPYDRARPGQRAIKAKGPLIDLDQLQAGLGSGNFDEDSLWFATPGAQNDREKYRWSNGQVLQMLLVLRGPALQPNDFRKSEWCDVNGGRTVPCDVYRMHYDLVRYERNVRGTEMYFKFSVDDSGVLAIVLASCYPSR
jgi:hypothetical protein